MIIFSVKLYAPLSGGDRTSASTALTFHYKHDKMQIILILNAVYLTLMDETVSV